MSSPGINNTTRRCYLCGEQFEASELVRDHVVPYGRGGSDRNWNRAWACRTCDNRKSDFLLSELEWVSDETKRKYAHLEREIVRRTPSRSAKRLQLAHKRIELARLALSQNHTSEQQLDAAFKAIAEAKQE